MKNELTTLTEQQKRVAEEIALTSLTDEPLNYVQLAEKHKISRKTLWNWRQLPSFIEYQNTVSNVVMKSLESEVKDRLMKVIRSNNDNVALKGIETYLKMQGLLNQGNQTNIIVEQPAQATIVEDIRELEAKVRRIRQGQSIDADIIEEN